ALDAAKRVARLARGKSPAVDHDAVDFVRLGLAVEFDLPAGLRDARVQFRQHAPRLDMTLLGKEQGFAETALERGVDFAYCLRVEPAVAGSTSRKTFVVDAVARMCHHQRAVERGLREMFAPQSKR